MARKAKNLIFYFDFDVDVDVEIKKLIGVWLYKRFSG